MIKPTITLGTSPQVLLRPSAKTNVGFIQNNGNADARLSWDGGAWNGLSNPTTAKGYLLAAGQQVWLAQLWGSATWQNMGDRPPIIGVCATSTSIDVGTDDALAT